jgi:hypothetical protein
MYEDTMHESAEIIRDASTLGRDGTLKKTYQKPAFRQERLFETNALSCGKVHSTQAGCHSNRKNS